MESIDYQVKRDDVLIGRLGIVYSREFSKHGLFEYLVDSPKSHPEIVREMENQPWHLDCKPEYYSNDYDKIRNMLFILDENQLAEDLLYNSPHYPVFALSKLEDCETAPIAIVLCFKMGRVLEYLGYPEILTYSDIVDIYENILGDWILDHSSLFGLYETSSHESGMETYDRYGNHRTYNDERDDGPIPGCYFDNFWLCRGDPFGFWFVPDELEENVKPLQKTVTK